MKIMLCYKDYKIGLLSFDKKYHYQALEQKRFEKDYGFLNFPLRGNYEFESETMPEFFKDYVAKIVFTLPLAQRLKIDLNKESDFSVLAKYASLVQNKNDFYFSLLN